MPKQINVEWMNEVLNDRSEKNDFSGDLPRIDWIQNGKGFKKELKFKLLQPNSKENNIFSYLVGTHWLNDVNGTGQNKRFVCTEQTQHLKKLGMECPICAAKRALLAKGFTEEQLSVQGKYGLIPLFDPKLTSNTKIVVLDTDVKHDWDKAHVSILQQNGSFLTKWLVERYVDADTPDLLQMERSNIIKFSRPTENGRWDREIGFATFEPTPEVLAKLREENEAITMPDLWKMPSDTEILEMKQIMADTIKSYTEARETVNATSITDDDDIPF